MSGIFYCHFSSLILNANFLDRVILFYSFVRSIDKGLCSSMSDGAKSFDESVWQVVSEINVGRVMSYGDVARVAGFPRRARMVARAMGRSPEALPWHRVVKSDLTIAFQKDSEPYLKQEKLLLSEGVKFVKGKIVPVASDKGRELDEVLWGPEGT